MNRPTWVVTQQDELFYQKMLDEANRSVLEVTIALNACSEDTHPALVRQIKSHLKTCQENLHRIQTGKDSNKCP